MPKFLPIKWQAAIDLGDNKSVTLSMLHVSPSYIQELVQIIASTKNAAMQKGML